MMFAAFARQMGEALMIGLGTIVNVLAILLGGCIGLLLKGGLPARYQDTIIKSLGLCTMFIGVSGALPGLLTVEGGALTGVSARETLGMILSFALGSLLGEWMDLDGRLDQLGAWLKARASRGEDNQFIQGFVTASLTVCIGAMAIVGSIQDGLSHDPSTLFTKSILDFIVIILFASTYGKGVLFSALPVGVLQGLVTLCAGLLAPVFSPAVIANLSFLGSMLIFCVGINLAFGTKFRVANMLPTLVLGALYTALI
jgi:uncharacterized membrane protein YqgA involved in biofilm formation